MQAIRKKAKYVFAFLTIIFLGEVLHPTLSYALTSGPTQPETHGFTPVGSTDMVDLFTGDFNYNIPLFELPGPNGGYPFNMAYHSGLSMENESGWVGLGWSLTPGVINRKIKGVPDDFRGDKIEREYDIKNSVTIGGGPTAGFEFFGAGPSASVGNSFYYNTYQGFGQTVENTLGLHLVNIGGVGVGYSHSVRVDSKDGLTFSPSIGLSTKVQSVQVGVGYGIEYNSRAGLQSHGYEASLDITTAKGKGGVRFGSRYSTAFKPQSLKNPIPMGGVNMDAKFSYGAVAFGAYGYVGGKGFFTTQYPDLGDDGKSILPSFGYLHLDKASSDIFTQEQKNTLAQNLPPGVNVDDFGYGEKAILDHSREKDGLMYKNMPNLAIPTLTADVLSMSGQGIGGSFRAFRSDIGAVHDPFVRSNTSGYGAGADLAPGYLWAKGGFHMSTSNSSNIQRKWSKDNFVKDIYAFKSEDPSNPLYEPYYFKFGSEMTSDDVKELDYIGGADAVNVKLAKNPGTKRFKATTKLRKATKGELNATSFNRTEDREARNTMIHQLSNGELITSSGQEINPEWKVSYYNEFNEPLNNPQASLDDFSRVNLPSHHGAGYIATAPGGARYVYALPSYTKESYECSFSAKGSGHLRDSDPVSRVSFSADGEKPEYKGGNIGPKDSYEYFDRTKVGAHPNSYLLTQLLGADYQDVDGVPGPSDGDVGYWVKFNYARKRDFNWRFPFSGAFFNEGDGTSDRDDIGMYSFGVRQQWYLKTAETKTHIAEFYVSPRHDNHGAFSQASENNAIGSGQLGSKSFKLDQIKLYTKKEFEKGSGRLPIKTVHFSYTYELCPGVPNNDGLTGGSENWDFDGITGVDEINQNRGKLTLRKMWFTYGNNTRGAFNPYRFDYKNDNPAYDGRASDRWGVYQALSDAVEKVYFPYTKQSDEFKTEAAFRSEKDAAAAAWHMSHIHLPSGGTIRIDLESDDYGYVQDEVAAQMLKITQLGSGDKELLSHGNRRVYFQLEKNVSDKEEVLPYFRSSRAHTNFSPKTDQLYFKLKMYVQSPNQPEYQTYIPVWADINKSKNEWYGVEDKDGDPSNGYEWGWVELKKVNNAHPFALAGWQFLQMQRPDITNTNILFGTIDSESSTIKKLGHVVTFAAAGTLAEIKRGIQGFNRLAKEKKWSTRVDVDHSWVRLQSPDRRKIGGGVRVKQLTFFDNWDESNGGNRNYDVSDESTYGVIYNYDKVEKVNGIEQVISSGVASYEPQIGGDENPLRKAKSYVHEVTWGSDLYLNFEYPINESYYPSPVVGYSRVDVRSLATSKVIKADDGSPWKNVPTTGASAYEFYTSRDFPVITEETEPEKHERTPHKTIPFIGTNSEQNVWASQGYAVQVNNMHGQLKQVSSYGQDEKGELFSDPYAYTKFHYQHKTRYRKDGTSYKVLHNEVETLTALVNAEGTQAGKEFRTLGQDFEFFTDMRESLTQTEEAGSEANVDIIPGLFLAPTPIPSIWPKISKNKSLVRTIVTNKVIYRNGILKKIERVDEGLRSISEIALFDSKTGDPVLTKSRNNFDAPIYSYSVPSHLAYEQMGSASQNQGLSFDALISAADGFSLEPDHYLITPPLQVLERLQPGDEYIVSLNGSLSKARYVRLHGNSGQIVCEIQNDWSGHMSNFLLTKSGFTNQISKSSSSVVGLEDPTINYTLLNCSEPMVKLNRDQYTKVEIDYYEIECRRHFANELLQKVEDFGFYDQLTAEPSVNGHHFLIDFDAEFLDDGQTINPFRVIHENYVDCISQGDYLVPDDIYMFSGRWTLKLNENVNFNYIYPVEWVNYNCGPRISIPADKLNYPNTITNLNTYVPPHDFSDCVNPNGYAGPFGGGWFTEGELGTIIHFYPIRAIPGVRVLPYTGTPTSNHTLDIPYTNGLHVQNNYRRKTFLKEKYVGSDINVDYSGVEKDDVLNVSSTSLRGSHLLIEYQGFVFSDSRTQTKPDVDLSGDGVMNNVPLFDWKNPFFTECNPQWVKTTEVVSRDENAHITESTTLLDVPGATLIGYDEQLILATATNAELNEIAYEGFEEYNPGQQIRFKDDLGGGQLDVVINSSGSNTGPEIVTSEDIDIISGNGNLLILDQPFDEDWAADVGLLDNRFKFVGHPVSDATDNIVQGDFTISNYEAYPGEDDSKSVLELGADFPWLEDELFWMGEMTIETSNVGHHESTSLLDITSIKAHTGKKSLHTAGQFGDYYGVKIDQHRLSFKPGENYLFSAWTAIDDQYSDKVTVLEGEAFDYSVSSEGYVSQSGLQAPQLGFTFYDAEGIKISSQFLKLKGKLVKGWQQLEGVIHVPQDYERVELYIDAGKKTWSIQTAENNGVGGNSYIHTYFDDLRIHPYDAEMQTYVYDEAYRLSAVLDRNNFAQFTYYNSEGQPFLIKQETKDGIYTTTESRENRAKTTQQ